MGGAGSAKTGASSAYLWMVSCAVLDLLLSTLKGWRPNLARRPNRVTRECGQRAGNNLRSYTKTTHIPNSAKT